MSWKELTELVYNKMKGYVHCLHYAAISKAISKGDYYFEDVYFWTSRKVPFVYVILDYSLEFLTYDTEYYSIIRELIETKDKDNIAIAKELFVQSYNKVNVCEEIK